MKFEISKETSNLLKFIACWLVALSHYATYMFFDVGNKSLTFNILEAGGGYAGVSIFFFLSGYGLMQSDLHKHLGLKNYLSRRLSKVYWPVLLVTATWFLILHLCQLNESTSTVDNIKALFWGGKDGVLWFVKIIILLYVAFYVFTSVKQLSGWFAHVVFVVLLCLICTYSCRFIGTFSFGNIPMFYLGMLASLNKNRPIKGILLPLVVIALVICIVSFGTFGMSVAAHSAIDYATICCLVVMLLLTPLNSLIRCNALLGAISFDIYLVHNKCLMLMKHFMDFIPCYQWVLATIVSALGFYLFRNYLKLRDTSK